MEYLIGSLITLIALFIINKLQNKSSEDDSSIKLFYSQSHIYSMLKPFLSEVKAVPMPLNTQASAHDRKRHIRVILADSKAYWIVDNTFFEADEFNGFIDKESAKPVDIMGMDKVQLDKMIAIVEALTEGGSNENWHSGK